MTDRSPALSTQRGAPHARLAVYRDLLLAANATLNLTAVRDPAEIDRRHNAESVAMVRALEGAGLLPHGARVIDVGSGGGLPGVPLAILRPDVSVTLLEATGKKAAFLRQVAERLQLTNVRVLAARAEDAAHRATERELYDLATARAVAALPTLMELTLPFVKLGGAVAAAKGSRADDEIAEAATAIALLGGDPPTRLPLATEYPLCLVVIAKRTRTPDRYPRRPGMPTKRPLR